MDVVAGASAEYPPSTQINQPEKGLEFPHKVKPKPRGKPQPPLDLSLLMTCTRGREGEKVPQEVKKCFSTATLPPPPRRVQKILPAGVFFYPNPPLPQLAHRPPPKPPPPLPPKPHPTHLAPSPPQNFYGGCPGYHGQAGQSHGPDPGADSQSARLQAHEHHLPDRLFTYICTGAHWSFDTIALSKRRDYGPGSMCKSVEGNCTLCHCVALGTRTHNTCDLHPQHTCFVECVSSASCEDAIW